MEKQRCDYLDNVKWTLAILVILHHAASMVGHDPFVFNYPEVALPGRYQYDMLRTFQSVNQGYFMSLFFFISACFVAPSFDRKGWRVFLGDKLVRLGIPVLLTILLVDPLAWYCAGDQSLAATYADMFGKYAGMLGRGNMLMGVTWFCWALLLFCGAYALARGLGLPGPDPARAPRPIPSLWAMLAFAVAMIPCNYAGLCLMQWLGEDFFGLHLLKYFPMYVAMFCLGIRAQANGWLEQLTFRHAFAGIVAWLLAFVLVKPMSQMASRPFEVLGMGLFLLYAYRTLFSGSNNWSRRLARWAYAAYVVQVVPLTIVGRLFLPHMTQYPLANFAVVAVPSVAASFLLAWGVCRVPGLRRIF